MKVQDIASIGFRMQPELKEWLKTEAARNLRTMNSELVFILENEKARRAATQRALDELTPTSN